jgi:hypothetical protein
MVALKDVMDYFTVDYIRTYILYQAIIPYV